LDQGWEIHRDLLEITSDSDTTDSSIEPKTASANTEFGFLTTKVWGSVSGVRVSETNFLRFDVRENDVLTLEGPTYTTQHTVFEITNDGYQLEVEPEVVNDLLAHQYKVESEGSIAYETFESDMGDWEDDLATSSFDEDILELERVLNPIIVNKNPSSVLINDARQTAQSLETLYNDLSAILSVFTVTTNIRIDALLNMLQERGLDRAHDLLLAGEISAFFSLNKDSASYSGNFLEKMRNIAQNDAPSRRDMGDDHLDSSLTAAFTDSDADFDFSDQDFEDEPEELDDLPDLDDDPEIFKSGL
jgi:hypothetical protein